MIVILLLIPIIIYISIVYFFLKKLLKNKIIFLSMFVILSTLPFWDQLIGYYVFKYLCKNDGGIKIYKTVTNKFEQESYWLTKGIDVKARNYNVDRIFHYNLDYRQYLSSDFSKVYNLYFPKFYKYDKLEDKSKIIKQVKEYFEINKKSELSLFINLNSINEKLMVLKKNPPYIRKKFKTSLFYVDNSKLSLINVMNNKNNKIEIERGYINYCEDIYNGLKITDDNYKKSCDYADKLISKYNLKNIKKISHNRYRFYSSYFDREYKPKEINFFNILLYVNKIYDVNSNEILAEEKIYGFKGGWYLQMASYLLSGKISEIKICPRRMNSEKFQELVISNPLKQKNL